MSLELFILDNYQKTVLLSDLDQFANEKVFFNVVNPPAIFKDGSKSATPGSLVTLPVTRTSHGTVAIFYTTATDSRLGKPFAGVALEEAIQIIHSMKNFDGLVLQSSQESALVIEKSDFDGIKTR